MKKDTQTHCKNCKFVTKRNVRTKFGWSWANEYDCNNTDSPHYGVTKAHQSCLKYEQGTAEEA